MSESNWQNMHFAPKDGREILILTESGYRRLAYWCVGREQWKSPSAGSIVYKPRLWHELPPKP
jgi:hypothetical protein